MEHVKWGAVDRPSFMNWVEREGEGWRVKQRDLCTCIDCLERSLEMFVGPEGKSQWGDHTVEEKGGEEEMKQGPRGEGRREKIKHREMPASRCL